MSPTCKQAMSDPGQFYHVLRCVGDVSKGPQDGWKLDFGLGTIGRCWELGLGWSGGKLDANGACP